MNGELPTTDTRRSVRVVIEGQVQGVWFRGWTVQEATARRLDGWVRNRSDGTVEALISGPAPGVDEMVGLCWKGPTSARVTGVRIEQAASPEGLGFRQRPSM